MNLVMKSLILLLVVLKIWLLVFRFMCRDLECICLVVEIKMFFMRCGMWCNSEWGLVMVDCVVIGCYVWLCWFILFGVGWSG